MNIRIKFVAIIISLAGFIVPSLYAAQIVAPPLQNEVLYVAPNETLDMPINYSVSSPEGAQEVGLALRVHFDSSKLSFNDVSQALQVGGQPIGGVQDDTNNADNDANTDKFFVLAWVDLSGNWPGVENALPLNLFTSHFTANGNFSGSTSVAFTASSRAGEAEFSTTSQTICSKPKVYLSANEVNVLEGSRANLNVVIDQPMPEECGALSITLNASGTAVVDSDYRVFSTEVTFLPSEMSVPLTISTIDDSLIEADKSLVVHLAEGSHYSLSNEQTTEIDFNIISNDISLDLSISSTSIIETAENTSSTVTLTRSGYLGEALDVSYQLSGTASQGQDFSVSSSTNTFHFDAGQSSTTLVLTAINDESSEGDETIILTLQENESYSLPENSAVTLTIKDAAEVCIDIDGNGEADALTDGVLLARYLLGYRDDDLIDNSLSSGAVRTTAATVQSYIESYISTGCYDIDGSGNLDALSDGILLIRYLSDYRGDSLVLDAVGQGATRTTATDISTYIESLLNK